MLIAISSKGNEKQSLLDSHFGRCKYFYVYDTLKEQGKFIENEGGKASGGAGIQAGNQIVEESIDVVISGAIGPNASEILEKSNIKSYKATSQTIEEILDLFNNNKLEEM
ncbi:MAG: NifB/NifX family molybdenum-iron cluster-binding protein [Clostridiaceae bacterium]